MICVVEQPWRSGLCGVQQGGSLACILPAIEAGLGQWRVVMQECRVVCWDGVALLKVSLLTKKSLACAGLPCTDNGTNNLPDPPTLSILRLFNYKINKAYDSRRFAPSLSFAIGEDVDGGYRLQRSSSIFGVILCLINRVKNVKFLNRLESQTRKRRCGTRYHRPLSAPTTQSFGGRCLENFYTFLLVSDRLQINRLCIYFGLIIFSFLPCLAYPIFDLLYLLTSGWGSSDVRDTCNSDDCPSISKSIGPSAVRTGF